MTRMTGPDCAVMCNLINTHTHTHTGGMKCFWNECFSFFEASPLRKTPPNFSMKTFKQFPSGSVGKESGKKLNE